MQPTINEDSTGAPRSIERTAGCASPNATASSWTDTCRLTGQGRLVCVGSSVENLELTSRDLWVDCKLVPGETYRLRAIVEGAPETADTAGIVRFEGAEGGEGLRTASVSAGSYIYLRTGPGLHRTDRLFSVNKPCHRYGLRTWGKRGPSSVKMLTVERVDQWREPTDFFITFDVEALTPLAPTDHIDRLVWGKFDGQEYGLRRICNILEQYGLKGIFLIDFASCVRDGDGALRAIVEFLRGRNHEIQMHLHAEELARRWGLRINNFGFDRFSYDMCKRLLDYTMSTYRRVVEEEPRVFRSGGTRINVNLMLAARVLGIDALSNIRDKMLGEPALGGDWLESREPFLWDSGVVEFPIDYTGELSRTFERYLTTYEQMIMRKGTERTFNILFHSWSLITHSDRGLREVFEPEYELRFHEICSHMAANGTARGFGEYLNTKTLARRVEHPEQIRATSPKGGSSVESTDEAYVASPDVVTCNICDQRFSRTVAESGRCPSCGSLERQRQLKYVLDNFGNVFDGKSILAQDAVNMANWGLFPGASSANSFDIDNDINGVEPGSVECFVGLHMIGARDGAQKTIEWIAEVLKPGGVFVSTAPYRADGKESLDGIAKTALYLSEYVELLSKNLVVTSVPGYDAVTGVASRIFIAQRPG